MRILENVRGKKKRAKPFFFPEEHSKEFRIRTSNSRFLRVKKLWFLSSIEASATLSQFIPNLMMLRNSTHYNVADIRSLVCSGNLPATDASYRSVIRRFAAFHSTDYDTISSGDLTDEKIALFFHDTGAEKNCGVSTEKTFCAAFGSLFLQHGIPNIRKNPELWPMTINVLKVKCLQPSSDCTFVTPNYGLTIYYRDSKVVESWHHWCQRKQRSFPLRQLMQLCRWVMTPATSFLT